MIISFCVRIVGICNTVKKGTDSDVSPLLKLLGTRNKYMPPEYSETIKSLVTASRFHIPVGRNSLWYD